MENEAAVFSDQEYREMDRGALQMWLARIERRRLDGSLSVFGGPDCVSALSALQRLGGLMGEW